MKRTPTRWDRTASNFLENSTFRHRRSGTGQPTPDFETARSTAPATSPRAIRDGQHQPTVPPFSPARLCGRGARGLPDGHRWHSPQKSGSHRTHRWREEDSNPRSPRRINDALGTTLFASAAPPVPPEGRLVSREGPAVRIPLDPALSPLRTSFSGGKRGKVRGDDKGRSRR